MSNDATISIRLTKSERSAVMRAAKGRGQSVTTYLRRLVQDQVRRDAAATVRAMLGSARSGELTDEQAMKLAEEAKHASRRALVKRMARLPSFDQGEG
jgi:uncharacterized protein (DUF1778 family)